MGPTGTDDYEREVVAQRAENRSDARVWRSARTLDDLGQLTAAWLTGDLTEQPGYYGPVDVDEADAPGLTDTLVALNRAGFITISSQAGFDGPGADGAHWQQHAAVDGFMAAIPTVLLGIALRGTRFRVLVRKLGQRFESRLPGVAVTTREGQPYTTFGSQLTRSDIRETYPGCHRHAIDAVCRALHVAVYDPQPGSNDLWPALRAAVAEVSR